MVLKCDYPLSTHREVLHLTFKFEQLSFKLNFELAIDLLVMHRQNS